MSSQVTAAAPSVWEGGRSPYAVNSKKFGMWLFIISDSLTFFMELWHCHRQHEPAIDLDTTEEAICALMFNCEGYLHELLKIRGAK